MKHPKEKKTNFFGFSLALPKFSVKSIFILFAIVLILVQIYNGYEIYLLVDKIFILFSKAADVPVQITNLSFVSEFYLALHEAQPKLFSSSKTLKAIAIGSKKLPVFLLYVFFALIIFNYFTISDFNVLYYLKVGIHHILIHKVLHFLQHEKQQKWYNCICCLNRVKHFFKKRF